ncbi:filamentous hemagglutinin family N-terminal domain-containing protein [Pseudomonas delhiensis]|uniref:Filamentous hemagglutinin family N-terminal domain-containing protein n=1 Tax=Pseudomonas delhiensis TaxID=366289 RepID=A0A239KAD5_9PSED|nr:MBG domain-containing protein [Pseudomonas delhiensis]SDJ33620.1 filamentous hemagglutinin family N-terminal domain-containing protein [Pseudomonas delhiensis]SNT14613.1 filamentous hemagglutinin family N-terminal domain-containing protein [Pseudomonas delhiensis]
MKHRPTTAHGLRLSCLYIAVVLASTGSSGLFADALPQGGQVVGGQASISQNGANMEVTTAGPRTAIDWQRFNVGPDNSITFKQPDGRSVTLNRVIGSDPSKIYGAITSNGQLILVNPNGVWLGPNSRIAASALVASAGFVTDEQAREFAASGKLDIQLKGLVRNEGHITVHDNGMVALLGAQVENHGVIQARKGTAKLATGPRATLDFHGDGLLNIAVGGEPGERDSVNADVKGGVHNSGQVDVGNGVVAMSAERAARHLDSVINVGGNVSADSVSEQGGSIVLGNAAQTNVSGTLSAKGTSGGSVKVLGDEVSLAGSAKIDASGSHGAGGKVLVGGSYQGKGPEPAARSTTVAKGAELKADGRTDGGQVVAWSGGQTQFAGNASARGGERGGVVETSGKQLRVTADAKVDTSGKAAGKWLLDPVTVNIVADADAGPTTGDLWNVSATAIANGLATNNVEVSASQRINVNSAIIATNIGQDGNGQYNTLALIAAGNPQQGQGYSGTDLSSDSGSVYINAPILLKDGNLFIAATGDIRLVNNDTTGNDYSKRAIIDVGQGIAWLRTSNVASIVQDQGTALMGHQVALEGASVRMESNLNYAGTLAGKASNGIFRFNQTNASGTTTTGTVASPYSAESLTGVTAQQLEYRGYQDIVADPGTTSGGTSRTVTLQAGDGKPFDYLVFEATGFVTPDGNGGYRELSPEVLLNYLDSSDYLLNGLSFTDAAGVLWNIRPDANDPSLSKVTRTDPGGSPVETSLPVGFAFGANGGLEVVSTFAAAGWGVEPYQYIPGASDQKEIQHNAQDGSSQQLIVNLGGKYDSVEALIGALINDTPWLKKADPNGPSLQPGEQALERARVHFYETVDKTDEPGVILNNAAPAKITVSADDKSREYGDANPTLTNRTEYDTNAQAVKGVDDYVNQQLRRDGTVVGTPTTDATAQSDVKAGGYAIDNNVTQDARAQGRYQVQDNKGTLTVEQAELKVRADEKSKVYGDADPALTYQVSGQKFGEQAGALVGGNLNRAPGQNVGDYAIGQGGVGSLSGNYRISYEGNLLHITPAQLEVTAHDKTKVYGDADPALSYSVSGLKNGDSAAAVLNGGSLQRQAGENVRPQGYAIGQGGLGLASHNYTLVFRDGNLQITPAQLVVTADDKSKAQGQPDPRLTYSVSGLKNGDRADVARGSLARAPGEEPGAYAIGQGQAFDAGANYSVVFRDGTLSISGPLAEPEVPRRAIPMDAQAPGNVRCTALESPSAVSANYSVSPAVIRTYAVQLICKPRAYGDKVSTTPELSDVLTYANSLFKDGKLIVPDWNRSVIPHDLKAPAKGGK